MAQTQECPQVQYLTLQELPIVDLSAIPQLAAQTQALFAYGSKAWIQIFQAITYLRVINKTQPYQVNALLQTFGAEIVATLDDVKPIIQRNTISLIAEIFMTGNTCQVIPQVFDAFLPKIFMKSQNSEHKSIKNECMNAINQFVLWCSHQEAGIVAVCHIAADNKRPLPVQKFAIEVLGKLIQITSSQLAVFQVATLDAILQCLNYILHTSKAEIQNFAFQLVLHLHKEVGDQGFRNWMAQSLNFEQQNSLVKVIQDFSSKKSKSKQPLGVSNMKQRITFGQYQSQEEYETGLHFQQFVQDKKQACNFLDWNMVQVQNENQYLNYQQY